MSPLMVCRVLLMDYLVYQFSRPPSPQLTEQVSYPIQLCPFAVIFICFYVVHILVCQIFCLRYSASYLECDCTVHLLHLFLSTLHFLLLCLSKVRLIAIFSLVGLHVSWWIHSQPHLPSSPRSPQTCTTHMNNSSTAQSCQSLTYHTSGYFF